jgi:hypothetical protein
MLLVVNYDCLPALCAFIRPVTQNEHGNRLSNPPPTDGGTESKTEPRVLTRGHTQPVVEDKMKRGNKNRIFALRHPSRDGG